MKIQINRLAMLEAAKNVAKVAPSNAPIDVLRGVLVESNSNTGEVLLTATNHEVSIQQKIMAIVEESGTMLVYPRILVDMMTKLAGEFVSLSAERPELLIVKGGKCTFQINCLPSKSYPKPIMPFPEQSVIMSGICSLSKRTTFLVSSDENKLALQCVQVKLKNNAVHAAASDGIGRMMLVKDTSGPTSEQEFLLPGRSLQLLASISDDSDVFEVSDLGKEVVFVRGGMIFTIRKMATGAFIDTNTAVKNFKPAYTAVADVGKIKEALNLLSVSASMGNAHEPISLALMGGEIVIRCNSEYSEASTVVPAKVSADTPDAGFLYNVFALLKLFQVLSGNVKLEINASGVMLVKTRTEIYLQSPVSANAKKAMPVKEKKETERAKGAEGMKNEAA